MATPEPRHNPDNDDLPEVEGESCCICNCWIADDDPSRQVFYHNQLPYCDDHYYEIPAIVQALQAVGERGDYE